MVSFMRNVVDSVIYCFLIVVEYFYFLMRLIDLKMKYGFASTAGMEGFCAEI